MNIKVELEKLICDIYQTVIDSELNPLDYDYSLEIPLVSDKSNRRILAATGNLMCYKVKYPYSKFYWPVLFRELHRGNKLLPMTVSPYTSLFLNIKSSSVTNVDTFNYCQFSYCELVSCVKFDLFNQVTAIKLAQLLSRRNV